MMLLLLTVLIAIGLGSVLGFHTPGQIVLVIGLSYAIGWALEMLDSL